MLQVYINNKNMDLPQNAEIAVELTSPIFNDKGSSSLPYKIANSKRNQQTLGHPSRLSAAKFGGVNYPTSIKCDGVRISGYSEITEQGEETEMALKINEGAFWEWAKNTKMTELIFPEDPYPSMSVADKTTAWANRIKASCDYAYPNEMFTIFPVLIETIAGEEDIYKKHRILNLFNLQDGLFKAEIITTPFVGIKDFAPFIYLNAAISFICQSYGIRMVYNVLEETEEFNRMCIIHNSTMPVREGILNWKELLPADSVSDFISWIEGKFPVHFTVDMNKREASLISIEDICLKSEPIKVNGLVKVVAEEPRPFNMTTEHYSSIYSKPSEYTEEYLKSLPFQISEGYGMIKDGDKVTSANTPNYVTYPNLILFVNTNNCYYFLRWVNTPDDPTWKWVYQVKIIGNADRDIENSGSNTIKVETSFCVPAMVTAIAIQNIVHNSKNVSASIQYFVIPEYAVKLKDFVEGFFELNGYDDSVNFTPALCIYRGKNKYYSNITPSTYPDTSHETTNLVPWGSPYLYDKFGARIGEHNESWRQFFADKVSLTLLGEDGIYEKFWKFNANIFITSAKPITVIKGLQYFKNPRFDRLYRIGDTNFLLDIVKQTHTSTGIRVDEVTGRTVKYYE